MTTTTVATDTTAHLSPAAGARATGGWRVATRLARREVRRRWGRTLLVMMLVVVPVFGMTVITTLVRTAHETPARLFATEFGSANLAAIGNPAPPAGGGPAGTQITHRREGSDIGVGAAEWGPRPAHA